MYGAISDIPASASVTPSHPVLSVGVLVDLEWGTHAGGHVKCWERFAEAAIDHPTLDLTIYFLGHNRTEISLAPNVRYQILPPLLGTRSIPFLHHRSRDTDLAPYHPPLAQLLANHDVLHVTSAFSFSRTAHRVAKQCGIPLVCSVHTDLPKFTQIYSQEIVSRIPVFGRLLGWSFDRWKLHVHLARQVARRWHGILQDSDWVLVSRETDSPLGAGILEGHLSQLRRGIDKQRFNPAHRDRPRLQEVFGIPQDLPVLLFVGRVDDSKKVMTMAQAARRLLDLGYALHALVVGEGTAREDIQQLLGANVTLPGVLPQQNLSWLYASADLFVFPSESEISPNVVLEAKASGLPAFVSAWDNGAGFIQESGVDGVAVSGQNSEAWAVALMPYLENGELRSQMSLNARRTIEQQFPSWDDVLQEDLLKVWQKVSRIPGLFQEAPYR